MTEPARPAPTVVLVHGAFAGSHVIMISQPQAVVDVIMQAVDAVR